MEEKQAIVAAGDSPLIMDAMGLDQAQKQFKNLQEFVKSQMVVGKDFGVIPGCKKPSLWKPGAEKLLFFHGLGCKLEPVSPDTIADWAKGFFNYCYRATVYNPRTGAVIATSDASCNSHEAKYIKQDANSIVNTIQKMAQKRAMVGAALMACRASDIFTQDEGEEQEKDKLSDGKAKQEGDHSPISDGQRKRLFAIMKECGVEEEALAQHLRENYKYTLGEDGEPHSSKLSWKNDHYNSVINWLEKQKKK